MTKKLRGQTATFSIEDAETNTDIPVGVLDNPEVTAPEQEVQELRGTGSTEWVDIQKTETAVMVSGDLAAFDLDAWDRLIDWDEAAGELDDSADVKTFNVTVEYEAADGSTKAIEVGPGYIDGSVPLGGSRDEWIGMTIEVRAQTIKSITNTDATA
jgi:hypothetical protein